MTKSQQSNIIDLPYQLASTEELQNCDDIGVLSFQLRMYGVEQIRLIQAGQLTPTPDVMRNLNSINEQLRDFGKPELSLAFLADQS
ncbi:hypothetical protein [Mucilaginibacter gracilis]|nr:hypothetical protein [Mucilaginibacter gracilis]